RLPPGGIQSNTLWTSSGVRSALSFSAISRTPEISASRSRAQYGYRSAISICLATEGAETIEHPVQPIKRPMQTGEFSLQQAVDYMIAEVPYMEPYLARYQHPAVHVAALSAGGRRLRAARLPRRRRAGHARGALLCAAGVGDASRRRQLRERDAGVEPVHRVSRELRAVVRAFHRHGRRGLPDGADA